MLHSFKMLCKGTVKKVKIKRKYHFSCHIFFIINKILYLCTQFNNNEYKLQEE